MRGTQTSRATAHHVAGEAAAYAEAGEARARCARACARPCGAGSIERSAKRWRFAGRLAVGASGRAMKLTPQSRQCSQAAALACPAGVRPPGMFAQWDGAPAIVMAEGPDAPATLAKPGFATRSAAVAARSESQDFIARIGSIRRPLKLNSHSDSNTMVNMRVTGA